ncbi:MAG: hypothetical protein HXY49_03605 [Ignavibacteriaceae bacterium]|nr:hypothetical protein [Ignavibacteriaceae bacterium]
MLKIFSIVLLLLLSIKYLYAQSFPVNYKSVEELSLQKISETLNDNPASNSISDIIALGDTVWLGTSRGVSLSTDGGISWKNFYGSSAFGDQSISAIGYNNGTFWAATARSVEINGQNLPEGTGLKYTTDFGLTWNSIPQPLDQDTDTIEVYGDNTIRALPVTVAVQNLIYDIAFTKNTIWIATFAGGLRKSTDNGQTWKRVVLPPDYLNSIKPTDTLDFCLQPVSGRFCAENNLNHRVFSISSANDSTLYVGTAGGINKSTDNGISWVKFNHTNQDQPISGNFIVALGFNKSDNSLWAATWKAEGESEFYGVSATWNGGESWKTFLQGERAHNFGFKSLDIIIPADNGPFRSNDLGNSWILPTSIFDTESGVELKTIIFYSAAATGADIWLGSVEGLVKLEQKSSDGIWEGTWKIFIASQPLNSNNDTYAYPNPFSPKLDVLKIKYSTGGKRAKVTIRIFDFGMNYLRTVVQNVDRGNDIHQIDGFTADINGVVDFWDGRDDAGNVVPNGVYFYRVEVDSNDPVYGKILVLQ